MIDKLIAHFGTQPDRRGEHHIDCPYCGKETARGQTHASFGADGFHCFVCGTSAGLAALAKHVGMDGDFVTSPRRNVERKPDPAPLWQADAEQLVYGYAARPEAQRLWMDHKPLKPQTIRRWQLGFGALPGQMSQRLIVPVRFDGRIVGLHGRAISDQQSPKWICATGSKKRVPFGLDNIEAGDVVFVVENYVDAMLLMQETAYKAVAMGSAVRMSDKLSAYIASKQPARVIVAYDNDMAGQATGSMLERLRTEWTQRMAAKGMTNVNPPEPAGPKSCNALIKAGVRAILFQWPPDAPAKADIGGYILA